MNYESGQGATYQYNGLGNRVGKVEGIPVDPILPIASIHDMSLNPIKQMDDVIDLTRRYHNLLQRNDNNKYTAFTWDNNVLAATATEGVYNYFQDDLGSPLRMMDRLGREKNAYGYDEFGQELYHTNKINQPFTYTGYQRDNIADTYFAQSREYNFRSGMFISKDKDVFIDINIVSTLNQYTYCVHNPIRYIDPMGFDPDEETLQISFSALEAIEGNMYSFNIGKGLWNKQIANQLDDAARIFGSSADDVVAGVAGSAKTGILPKGIKALGYAGIVIDVGLGINKNVQVGSSWEKTTSDAVVDGAFSIGGMLAGGAAGAKFGTAIGTVAPGAGNVAGAVLGFIVGAGAYVLTDVVKVNGKSIKDHLKDGINSLFGWN